MGIEDLFARRKGLDEICTVPDKIISVYALEQHIWAERNSLEAREKRLPERQTVEEFQIGPVRYFLNDILRNMAAPYKAEKKDNPIGQGYWIQAEFGSGKSHLLCFLAALALGNEALWDIVKEKETASGQGKRDSIYRFWEDGLKKKSTHSQKGVLVVAKTLVGSGGGAVGINDKGKRLSEYILESIKEQLLLETGKNLSLYPAELLADRYINQDIERYRKDLKKFLKDPRYFSEDEYEDADEFVKAIQQNKSPEYKRSCGNKLWRFYTEYLQVQPQVPAETEDILRHVVKTVLAEGYSGLLLILDEISLFMKDREENQRIDDEKTLVVLSNRLAKVENLPVWTVCAAQQAIEAKPGMGVKNIIAEDRLKLVPLLQNENDYYDIVLSRVREIKDPGAINNYYLHYSNHFTWPQSIGENEFAHFFPFHRPALEVLRDITHELTTARSAIHFMHQTLKHQVKSKGRELIRLWELFDETVEYEEDPSGVHAGLVAIKTKRENDFRAYLSCRNHIEGLTRGFLKVNRERGIKVIQTLFLYHVAHKKMQGLTAEELANAVMVERQPDSPPEENIQHYEILADNLKKELPQVLESFDEDKIPHYRFEPVIVGIDPNREFQKARDEAEGNEAIQRGAWESLLALEEWPVKTNQATMDLTFGQKSLFGDIAPYAGPGGGSTVPLRSKTLEINWQGRQITGLIAMRDFVSMPVNGQNFPAIQSDEDEHDFAVYVASRPVPFTILAELLEKIPDGRILLWTPDELNHEEKNYLLDFAAYLKLIQDNSGNESEDARAIINWVADHLKADMGKIVRIIRSAYGRGRFDAQDNSQMNFNPGGELTAIVTPLIDRVLSGIYESRDIKFDGPSSFKKEDGVKIINGIIKTGSIPRMAKPNQNISAVQNFGMGLKIIKKSAERELDVSENQYVQDIWDFIDSHLGDSDSMNLNSIYKNFMGVGGPKDYGLTRRIVQIYVLCLVRSGKIQVQMGTRSGLSFAVLDYSNLETVDFSARVLDAMEKVQKVAKPENWDILRPYAERLLDVTLEETPDDALISQYRQQLRQHFAEEKEEATRVNRVAQDLFATVELSNPYQEELVQAEALYQTEIESVNDINLILYALKEVFAYRAFDEGRVFEEEVADLALRMNRYRQVKTFLNYEKEIQTGYAYCKQEIPDLPQLKEIDKIQKGLATRFKDLKPYIDSEVKLKTELIGSGSGAGATPNSITALITAYSTAYIALHDAVTEFCDNSRAGINALLKGREYTSIPILQQISALQPVFLDELVSSLKEMEAKIFTCPASSKKSVQDELRLHPVHQCGLSFNNADNYLQAAEQLENEARLHYETTINQKLQILLNPAIRQRLEQGKKEKVIAGILACSNITELRRFLVDTVLEDEDAVDIINRYLKKLVVIMVDLNDFQPTSKTVEKEQVPTLVEEFNNFLNQKLEEVKGEEDTLPILLLE